MAQVIALGILCYFLAGPADVTSGGLDVQTVVLWSPSESRFFADDINRTLHDELHLQQGITIVPENQIFKYFMTEYQHVASSWTIFVDLREYACPEEIFLEHTLAYVSVTQIACPGLSNNSRDVLVLVDTRTLNRGSLVAQLTNSTKTTSSLALLFDYTGEEYFYERSSETHFPLVFEISIALDKCAATEQLKNLTAKTEIRDVVVIARGNCITELLTEASRLQLLFGRFRWLLYPTDGQFPQCYKCENVNGIVIREQNRSQYLSETRAEKLVQFVKQSIAELESTLTKEQLRICNNCSQQCYLCVQQFRSAMATVQGESLSVFLKDDGFARHRIVFDLHMMSDNHTSPVGEWSDAGGLQSFVSDLFPDSKGGNVLRAVVVIEPPFVFRTETKDGINYTGYSLDVLQRISEELGFSYVVRECYRNEYGTSEEGGWSGCIGNVIRGEADVIVGALTVTAEREEVMDFTLPYFDFAGIQILMKKPTATVNVFYFVDVFTTEAWLCLFGVLVLTSFLLYVFERFSPRLEGPQSRGNPGEREHEVPKQFDLKESIWFVIGSVTLAGGGEPPRCLASRLLVAGFWFFSVVIMSTFTANLAAFLTVSRMGTTIASLDELAGQSDVKYSVVRDSNVKAYFEHQATIEKNFYELWKNMSLGTSRLGASVEQSLAVWDYPLGDKYGNMWSAMQTTGLLNSTQDGLEKVLKGNFALITESPVIKYFTSRDCSLTAVGDQFSVRPYAFALKEKSLFTSRFTTTILKLQKDRKLEDLKRKWWDDESVMCPVESGDQGLDLSALTGTFVVIGGGLCLGLIVLGAEFLINSSKKKQLEKALRTRKDTPGNQSVCTVECSTQNAVTLDQLMLARELKKKLELAQSS